MKRYSAALAIVIGLALSGIPQAGYSDGLGVDVSPAKLELQMQPGTNYNIPVSIHNSTASDTHIQASMVDFGVASNGNYQIDRVGSRAYSLMKYASINPREFDLPASTTQQVRLSVSLPPAQGLSGEYAGIVFFQTRPIRRSGVVAFSARIATKVYMTVPGTVKVDGAIAKMSALRAPDGELYRVLFKNLGNSHVYLRGQVEVQQGGHTIDRVQMPSEQLVERAGDRIIEVTGKSLPHGKYQAIATIDYGGKAMTGGEIAFEVK